MARYVCSYKISAPPSEIQNHLRTILQQCDFEVIYNTNDYLMARETPGKITFSKLVTVEALINSTTATEAGVQTSLVIKNEELPLKTDNHCHQLFELMRAAIAKNYQWEMIEDLD